MSRLSADYHHGNLATALVDEAVAQVRAVGAEKVSLRGLAAALGVSPSAAYAHFGDKDALLSAVGQHGFEALRDRMAAGVAAVPGDDDAAQVAKLQATGVAYVGFAAAEPHLFRLMFGPLCATPVPTGEAPAPDSAYGLLDVHLRELERRGLLRVPADDALRLMIWSAVHGFASLVIEGQVEPDAGTALFGTLQRLLAADADGWGASPATGTGPAGSGP